MNSWQCLKSAMALCVVLTHGAAVFARDIDGRVHNCLAQAASKHQIPLSLLMAIAETESGFKPHIVRKPFAAGNLDGSTDYGLMQINSWWLPTLAKYGIRQEQLFDACINADVGAWILAQNFQKMGYSWLAVGAYNAVSTEKRWVYAARVSRNLVKYVNRPIELRQASTAQVAMTGTTGHASSEQSGSYMGVWEAAQ